MSGGGGKGGQSKQSIDPRLAAASAEALTRAADASKIPYSPNRGVTIAAFTPQQEAAMRNTSAASTAFGLDGGSMAAMPAVETSASGVRGYSTGADFDEMVKRSLSPEIIAAIDGMFKKGGGGSKSMSSSGKKATGIREGLFNTMGMNRGGGSKFAEGK
jgi:hypothetical protein